MPEDPPLPAPRSVCVVSFISHTCVNPHIWAVGFGKFTLSIIISWEPRGVGSMTELNRAVASITSPGSPVNQKVSLPLTQGASISTWKVQLSTSAPALASPLASFKRISIV